MFNAEQLYSINLYNTVFLFYLAPDHKMLSLRFNRNDPHDSVFLKKKNHKKIINVTHYDSIIAVVVILFVALHLFSLYIKKPNSSYYTEHSKLFLIGTCCSY